MNIALAPYDIEFLDLSWEWLNDPEIKALTNTPTFTRENQRRWFQALPSKADYLIWGILVDGRRVGACGLKNITAFDCEFWSYIGLKNLWGKGIGKIIMALMEAEAKAQGLESIWLQVLRDHGRARRLYLGQGYLEESEGEILVKMRKLL